LCGINRNADNNVFVIKREPLACGNRCGVGLITECTAIRRNQPEDLCARREINIDCARACADVMVTSIMSVRESFKS
jgi:hypothetical protein